MTANNFIEALTDLANDLAGKTPTPDRIIDNLLGKKDGRKLLNVLYNGAVRIQRNSVVGNLGSVLSQAMNLPTVSANVKNPADFAGGFADAAKAYTGDKELGAKLAQSNFLTERYMGHSLTQFDTSVFKRADDFATWLLEFGDKRVAEGAYFAFLREAERLKITGEEAVLYADKMTRKSVGGRGVGELPVWMRSRIVKMLAPFQVEVLKQWNTVWDKIDAREFMSLVAMFGTAGVMNFIREISTGTEGVSLDPIGAAGASLYKDYKAADVSAPAAARNAGLAVLGNTLGNMPFGGQIADYAKTTLNLPDNDVKKWFGAEDPSRFGTGGASLPGVVGEFAGDLLRGRDPNVLKPLALLAPGIGGKQIEKTVRGLQDMAVLPEVKIQNVWNEEPVISRKVFPASHSRGGELRFPIEQTAGNMAKAALFGSFATPEGRSYLESGYKPLSEGQTSRIEEAYGRAAVKDNIPPAAVFGVIRNRNLADTDASNGVSDKELKAYAAKVAEEYGLPASYGDVIFRIIKGEQGEKT